MEKIINIRFEGDNSLKDEQKLSFTRYINRIFAGQKDDMIASNGHIKITSKKGQAGDITFVSDDSKLNKRIGLKLSNSQRTF